jgi:hypothetical protein
VQSVQLATLYMKVQEVAESVLHPERSSVLHFVEDSHQIPQVKRDLQMDEFRTVQYQGPYFHTYLNNIPDHTGTPGRYFC